MKKILPYVSLGIAGVAVIGIGLIIDRVGGVGIRTDDISSHVSLSISQPLLRGVPLMIRWQGNQEENLMVMMQLVSEHETLPLESGKLSAGFLRITIPCALSSLSARLELVESSSSAILAFSPVTLFPPGPDCVR